MLRARDVMTRKVVTVDPRLRAVEAAALLLKKRIGGAPVVGRDGVLLGIVSRSDLLRGEDRRDRPPAWHIDGEIELRGPIPPDPESALVEDVMTPAAVTARPETPVAQLARFMRARRVHRVPITRGRRLLGIVTALDLAGIVARGRSRRTKSTGGRRASGPPKASR